MSDDSGVTSGSSDEEVEEYEAEKIIGKRIVNGRVEYFVKWMGYGDEDNTWERGEDLECQKLILEFEEAFEEKKKGQGGSGSVKKAKEKESASKKSVPGGSGFDRGLIPEMIIGGGTAADSGGEIMFLMKWKDTEEADLVHREEANERCPHLVIAYYEENLSWKEDGMEGDDD